MFNKKKIAYFNCTGIFPHIGCLAVTDSHITELLKCGYDLFKIYSTYETRFLRTDSREQSFQLAISSELKSIIEMADAVVINGEGSIHHKGGQDLLVIAELAQHLDTPVFIVNAVIQEVEGYDDVLKKLDDLTVREVNSYNYLKSKGISSRIVLDSIIDANFSDLPSHSYEGEFLCTDWQAQRDKDVGATVLNYLNTQNERNITFVPFSHWSYMQEMGWRHAIANFRHIDFLITGRHHAVYIAGLAGAKFVAMPSNTYKIEGTIACSGLPIPICDNPKDLNKCISFARSNPNVFKDFKDYLESNKKLSTFDKLRSKISSKPVSIIHNEYKDIFLSLKNKSLKKDFDTSLSEAKSRIKNKNLYLKKIEGDKEIRMLKKVISDLENKNPLVPKVADKGFKKDAHKLMADGYYQKSIDLLVDNLAKSPRDNETLYILGLAYIYIGDVCKGLKLLDNRSYIKGFFPKTSFYEGTPIWDGEITNEKVVIWSSAGPGIGSEIFFLSMLSTIIEKQKNHLIVCDGRLIKTLKRSFPNGRFCGYQDIGENGRKLIKYQCSIFSLPKLYFKLESTEELNIGKSYLSPDKAGRDKFKLRYKKNSNILVGISWFTPNKKSSHYRSLPDDLVLGLINSNKCRFISLQHDYKDLSLYGNSNIYFDESFDPRDDIDQLISQVSAMDYVVTIDNSIAFLAGALGVTTFLLLPKQGNWPWEVCRKYDGFYPSITIIQQRTEGDWSEAIKLVSEKLNN